MKCRFGKYGKLFLVAAVLTAVLCSVVFGAQASAVKTYKFRSAVVTQLELNGGTAQVSRGAESIVMYDGMRLSKGDVLKTEGDATVYILVDQDKIIRLDRDSEAELTDTLLGSKVKITLKSGSMFFNVVEKLAEDESLQFVYGNVTISVRGTSAAMKGMGGAFDLILADGTVGVGMARGNGMPEESMEVTSGTKFEYAAGSGEQGTEPVIKTRAITLSELPQSVISEMKKDDKLAARIVESVPVSISPSGAVYAKPGEVKLEEIKGTPDSEAMEFSEEVRRSAGLPTETQKQKSTEEEVTTQAPTESPTEPTTQAPTESPTEPTTQAPTESPTEPTTQAPTESPTEPTTQAPTESPTEPTTQSPTESGKIRCPGCGLEVTAQELAANHGKAACGKHYVCAAGYRAEDHGAAACGTEGHFNCDGKTHELASCGVHYQCANGFVRLFHIWDNVLEKYLCQLGK